MFIKNGDKRMKASLIYEYSGCKKSGNSERWYITLNKAKSIDHVYFVSLEECEAALAKMDEDLKCKSNKTKWNKPNVVPDDRRAIILKLDLKCGESGLIGGFYIDQHYCEYTGVKIDIEKIIGWCETIK